MSFQPNGGAWISPQKQALINLYSELYRHELTEIMLLSDSESRDADMKSLHSEFQMQLNEVFVVFGIRIQLEDIGVAIKRNVDGELLVSHL